MLPTANFNTIIYRYYYCYCYYNNCNNYNYNYRYNYYNYIESQKTIHLTFNYNFRKFGPILKIFSF